MDHRPGTAYPVATVRTCTPAGEEGVPVPGGMEQGVLNVQPGQVGAAPDEVPLCPEAGEPVPQVVGGISPDRRVAVQSERLAEDLDGQRFNVRQLRRRPTAPQTGLPENLPHGVFDHAVQPDQTQVALHAPQGSGALEKSPSSSDPARKALVTHSPSLDPWETRGLGTPVIKEICRNCPGSPFDDRSIASNS